MGAPQKLLAHLSDGRGPGCATGFGVPAGPHLAGQIRDQCYYTGRAEELGEDGNGHKRAPTPSL